MPDRPASAFRGCIIRAYTVRSHIACGHYKQAASELASLREDLVRLPDCPPHTGGADPRAIADALVGHGESGSPFGMLLEVHELETLLDRITGDIEEARAQSTEARS